ncbi:MAG: isochorismatase family protein [Pseudomonadota bacterium]|nr:isochorismatase family protein [Pseudomonadota bacterium]
MSTEQNFSSLGYGTGSVGFGNKCAVVIVDFQRTLTDPSFPMGAQKRISDAVDATAPVAAAARAAGLPVVSCYTAYSHPSDALHWKVEDVKNWITGTKGCEIDPRVHEAQYDSVFCKTGPSIFFHTGAAPLLTKMGVDTVIITGCTTSGCVRASIIDAFSYGFRVIVPEDCCGDPDPVTHRANLEDVGRRYCDVVTSADVIGHLSGQLEAAE